ncbi:MAG: TonB-dependent receptor, partial [Mariprofundaceae bacterium]|nr:TonB-dependent receptor [Mariprofundaceae bacterium]
PADVSKTLDSYLEAGALLGLFEGMELDLPAAFRRRETDATFSGFRVQSTLRTMNLRPRLNLSYASAFNARASIGADIERGRGALSSFDYKRTHDGYYGHLSLSSDDKLWVVSGGARSEKLDDRFTSGASRSSLAQNKATWEAGAALNISPLFGLHLNAATSVRFPLLDERFNFISKSIVTTLLPQTGKHYGLSVHSQMQDVALDLSFNRADLSKEIFFNPTSFNNENYTDKTRHDVWMLQGQWQAADWVKLRANYTYTRASFRAGGFDAKSIPAVPKQRFGMAVDSEWGHGFGSTLDVAYVGNSFLISDQANAAVKLPAYLVANLVARYRWQDMDTFLRIDNLGNRKYSRYGVHSAFSGDKSYPAPVVSVSGGFNYRF